MKAWWFAIGLAIVVPRTHAEQAILERVDPIDLRWVEATVASGTGVVMNDSLVDQAAAGGSEQSTKIEYPFLWKIEFIEGRRTNKTPGARGDDIAIEETVKAIGSVLIAARFEGGREVGKRYFRELVALVEKLEAHSLSQVFSSPETLIEAPVRGKEGDERLEYCVVTDSAAAPSGVITKQGNTIRTSMGQASAARCEPLQAGGVNAVESARFRIGYELLSTLSESLSLGERNQLDRAPIEWPSLVTKRERPIEPNEGWFSTVDENDNGAVSTEAVRPTAAEQAAGIAKPTRVLELTLENGPLPVQLARGRGLIYRFELRRVERILGAHPRDSGTDSWAAFVALLLPSTDGGIRTEQFVEEVVADLAPESWPLTPRAILSSGHSAGRSLGRHDLVTVFCPPDPEAEPGARYCVRHACAKITNGEVFCDALETEFARGSN